MFVEVVTLVTLAIFWGRFEADFLTTDAKSEARGQKPEARGQRPEVRGQGFRTKIFSQEGCFQAYQACKACQANVCGLSCDFRSVTRGHLLRLQKSVLVNVYQCCYACYACDFLGLF